MHDLGFARGDAIEESIALALSAYVVVGHALNRILLFRDLPAWVTGAKNTDEAADTTVGIVGGNAHARRAQRVD